MSYCSRRIKSWPYELIEAPVATPVTLAEVREKLRISDPDNPSDAELTLLINAATSYAQDYMRIVLITSKFRTFRDYFENCIELRKAPFAGIELFQYLKDGTYVEVGSDIYYVAEENGYDVIYQDSANGKSFPSDVDDKGNAIKIEFLAGFGDSHTDVPDVLRNAILEHIAMLYENVGDCGCNSLPASTKMIYNMYRIRSLGG